MSFEFQCQCGKLLSAEEEWSGKNARCPQCGLVLVIPDPTTVALDEPAAAQPSADEPQEPQAAPTPPPDRPRRPMPRHSAPQDAPPRKLLLPNIRLNRPQLVQIGVALAVLVLLLVGFWQLRRSHTPQRSQAAGGGVSLPEARIRESDPEPAPATTGRAESTAAPIAPETAPSAAPEPAAEAAMPRPAAAPTQAEPPTISRVDGPAAVANRPGIQWFQGVRRSGIVLPTGEALALFLETSRPGLRDVPLATMRSEILEQVTLNDADLVAWLHECRRFSEGMTVKGHDAADLRHVLVFPAQWVIPDGHALVGFSSGPVTHLSEIRRQFGPPSEEQLWPADEDRQLMLTGRVSWWGGVGLATMDGERISHVLIRGPMDNGP